MGPVGDADPEAAPPRAQALLRQIRRLGDGFRSQCVAGQARSRVTGTRAPARSSLILVERAADPRSAAALSKTWAGVVSGHPTHRGGRRVHLARAAGDAGA